MTTKGLKLKALADERLYDVMGDDGNIVFEGIPLLKAKMYCIQNPGWTMSDETQYTQRKSFVISKPMDKWITEQMDREKVSFSEIVRRCIQAQMDKRNRFYILKSPYNRA